MKRLLAIALVVLFTGAVLSPAAFANCGKDHTKSKTATTTTTKKPTSA
jgi:hypothetical protein